MNDRQKNQAIADKCPGRFIFLDFNNAWHHVYGDNDFRKCLTGSIIDDLNAMHIAEEIMTDVQYAKYENLLAQYGFNAPPRQRADAIAKVFGLW